MLISKNGPITLIQLEFNQGDASWMGNEVPAKTGLGRASIVTYLNRMMSHFSVFKTEMY